MCNRFSDAPAKAAATGNHTLSAAWTPILGTDANRRSAVIYNDGPNPVYLVYTASTGKSTGSADSVSFKLVAGASLEIRHVLGVWAADPVGGSVVYVESETGVAS